MKRKHTLQMNLFKPNEVICIDCGLRLNLNDKNKFLEKYACPGSLTTAEKPASDFSKFKDPEHAKSIANSAKKNRKNNE